MERHMINLSRRTFMQGLCATGAAAPLAAACQNAGPAMASGPFFQRHNVQIGIQLYTLVDMLANNLEGAISGVAEIGYQTVEIPSYMGKTPAELRALLDKHGVKCTAAHIGMNAGTAAAPGLRGDLGKLAADMHTLGATHIYAPSMPAPDDIGLTPNAGEGYAFIVRVAEAMGVDRWKRFADELSDVGSKLKASGIAFGYHNHNYEFAKAGDRTGFDIIVQESDPAAVSIELDVGWAAAAGQDVVALFEKYSGRYTGMHIKDIKASTVPNIALKMDPSDVGSGKLDWATILPAAHKAGVRNFFLEQEAPFDKPRLESAANGYKFLSTLEA
jgi:sugar phosphate isomerase/epimerase